MRKILKPLVLLLIFLTVSFNITYWAITKYNVMEDLSAAGDAKEYIKMSEENYSGVQKRYMQRWLMPSIVSLVRKTVEIPDSLAGHYEIEEYKIANLSFGIINILFLTLTALFLFYFCRDLGFNDWEALTAGLLFLTSFFVVSYYTIPMIDSGSAFFIMAGYWAIFRRKIFWLMIIFTIGLFVKETTLVLIFAFFLSDFRYAFKNFWIFVPGMVMYGYLSYMLPNVGYTLIHNLTDKQAFLNSVKNSLSEISAYTFVENFQIFMFLWLFLIYAMIFKWQKIPTFLKRQFPVMALIFVAPFIMNTGAVGRAAFYVFPLAIPTIMVTLRDVFDPDIAGQI